MEVEVKLRLRDAHSHQKLADLLSPFHLKTLFQENLFFDTPSSSLLSHLAVVRLRFYDLDSHSVLSLKSKPTLAGGISRVAELEEPLDPALGRACVADPRRLLSLPDSEIVKRVGEDFGVNEETGIACLGGFRNVRAVYEWKGLRLELDETVFGFGNWYEIECESAAPERDKGLIEGFLKENGIDYSYSDANKFAIFRSGKLPP